MHDWREVKRWLIAGGVATLLIVLSVGIVVPRLIPEPKPLPERSRNIRATELVLVEEESIEEEELTRQIVSIDAPETEAVPRDARYEDRVNRVVDEETVARDRRLGMPSPAVAVAGTEVTVAIESPFPGKAIFELNVRRDRLAFKRKPRGDVTCRVPAHAIGDGK